MKITLSKLSKRFNYEWIFRDIDYVFESGNAYALTGPNGSGKSTLLKIISGQLTPSSGLISYSETKQILVEDIFAHVSFCAPYIDLIEEFTLEELLQFHFSFKKTLHNYSIPQLMELAELQKHKHKAFKSFSSGMKQRVKLITTLLADTTIAILDEPTTNLDNAGVEWYLNLVNTNRANRIIIVGSNMEREYAYCNNIINIADYKV